MYIPTYEDVEQAHQRVAPYIHETPVLTSTYFNDLTGAQLFFSENLPESRRFQGSRCL